MTIHKEIWVKVNEVQLPDNERPTTPRDHCANYLNLSPHWF